MLSETGEGGFRWLQDLRYEIIEQDDIICHVLDVVPSPGLHLLLSVHIHIKPVYKNKLLVSSFFLFCTLSHSRWHGSNQPNHTPASCQGSLTESSEQSAAIQTSKMPQCLNKPPLKRQLGCYMLVVSPLGVLCALCAL